MSVCNTTGLDDLDVFHERTTSNFSGMIAKIQDGWVAKWNNVASPLLCGLYAIDVKSELRLKLNEHD